MSEQIQIAIPSYRRPDVIQTHTLRLLAEAGFSPEQITVFLSDEEDGRAYGSIPKVERIVGPYPDFRSKLNAIRRHYPKGTAVLMMEDDIHSIWRKRRDKPNRNEKAPPETLVTVAQEAFAECRRRALGLWGLFPGTNAAFMQWGHREGLLYIIGYGCGFFATHEPELDIAHDYRQDFRRSLLYSLRDGAVLRREDHNWGTALAGYAKGGYGAYDKNRVGKEIEGNLALMREFPGFFQTRKRSTGLPFIGFRQFPPGTDLRRMLDINRRFTVKEKRS